MLRGSRAWREGQGVYRARKGIKQCLGQKRCDSLPARRVSRVVQPSEPSVGFYMLARIASVF